MHNLTLINQIASSEDKTRKFVYVLVRPAHQIVDEIDSRAYTLEVGVLDKGDGKDIICIPTQTNCAQGCRFCHSRGLASKVSVDNLTGGEMVSLVQAVYRDAGLHEHPERTLLISFMGLGEPMANVTELMAAMTRLKWWAQNVLNRRPIRFALATMLPAKYTKSFQFLTSLVSRLRLPLKVHFSLHYPTDAERQEWMPAAAPLAQSMELLKEYRDRTGNPVEIHYTPISGVNDTIQHALNLRELVKDTGMVVKFLQYNPLPGDVNCGTEHVALAYFRSYLHDYAIETEYYRSPGADIAASCGMFMTDAYIPKGSYGFGILTEEQTIGIAKNIRIGGCCGYGGSAGLNLAGAWRAKMARGAYVSLLKNDPADFNEIPLGPPEPCVLGSEDMTGPYKRLRGLISAALGVSPTIFGAEAAGDGSPRLPVPNDSEIKPGGRT